VKGKEFDDVETIQHDIVSGASRSGEVRVYKLKELTFKETLILLALTKLVFLFYLISYRMQTLSSTHEEFC
jgi:hypothetical protein